MELIRDYKADYPKKTKARKRCPGCAKLVADGDAVRVRTFRLEKWYPVRGLQWFMRTYISHEACAKGMDDC